MIKKIVASYAQASHELSHVRQ